MVPLFDGYRQSYRQASAPDRIRKFLWDRFEHNQSVILVAVNEGTTVGFTHLYPSFWSGALARVFILNDLFVDPSASLIGAGSATAELFVIGYPKTTQNLTSLTPSAPGLVRRFQLVVRRKRGAGRNLRPHFNSVNYRLVGDV